MIGVDVSVFSTAMSAGAVQRFTPRDLNPVALYDGGGLLQSASVVGVDTGDPVGILIDSAQGASFLGGSFAGLGAELFVSPVMTGAVSDAGGGAYTFDWTSGAPASVVVPNVLTIGALYLVSFSLSDRGSGSLAVSLQAFENGGTHNSNGTFSVLVTATNGDDIRFDRSGSAGQFTLSGITVMEVPGVHAQAPSASARPVLDADGSLSADGDDAMILPLTGTFSTYIAADGVLIADETTSMASDYNILRDGFIGAVVVAGVLTPAEQAQLAAYWGVSLP